VLLVVKLSQNPSLRKGPQSAFNDYAAQAAKRFTDQMKDPGSLELPSTLAPAYAPPPTTVASNFFVGQPAPTNPVCPLCGADSRYCRHSAAGAAIMNQQPRAVRVMTVPVETAWEKNLDRYFPRTQ
jgi:hypothetical protein